MEVTDEMIDCLFTGVQIAVLFLTPTALWCVVAGIVNKGVGG